MLFVLLRIAYSSMGAISHTIVPESPWVRQCALDFGIQTHTAPLQVKLVGVWQRWDACWYEKIATRNYDRADPAIAFLPLFPLLMHAAGRVVGGNFTLGGLIVSALAYLLAMVGLYRLVRDDFGDQIARRTVVFTSIFPTAFFLFMPYTEALFLALSVWTIALARRGVWGLAAGLAFCAGLTRMPAVLLALPLAWEVVRHWRDGRACRLALLAPMAPAAGFLSYNAYSSHALGWSYFTALGTWDNHQVPLWTALAASWRYVQHYWQPVEMLNLGLLVLFMLLLLPATRQLPFSYTLYAAAQLFLIGCRYCSLTPLMSGARYLLVVFPIFIVLAILCDRPWRQFLWVSFSLVALLFLTCALLVNLFVG